MIDLRKLLTSTSQGETDANDSQSSLTNTFFSGALLAIGPDLVVGDVYPLDISNGLSNPVPFASDAFGDLFVVHGSGVARIATESGEVDETWPDLQSWARDTQNNPDEIVGENFLKEWEKVNGPLPEGHRLTPKMPFIFGGSYELDNIVSLPFPDILRFRADIVRQTHDLPDGARILINTD